MTLDINVDKFLTYKESFITYNEIVITKLDIKRIPQLMNFFLEYNIYIEDEIKLNKFPKNIQNKIGSIFMKFYGFIVEYNKIDYFNFNKINELFKNSNKLLSILFEAKKLTNTDVYNKVDNIELVNLLYISEEDLNFLILNFFSLNYRNFISSEKYIKSTDVLTDVNLETNKFYKISNIKEFIISQFDRYIRTIQGSIPFSSNFGSDLRSIIHSKYTSFTEELLKEELSLFFNSFVAIYNSDISLNQMNISEVESASGVISLKIEIIIEINKEEVIKIKLI